jgi:hypothetical protein
MNDAGDKYCGAAENGVMQSNANGGYPIIYSDTGTGEKTALILLYENATPEALPADEVYISIIDGIITHVIPDLAVEELQENITGYYTDYIPDDTNDQQEVGMTRMALQGTAHRQYTDAVGHVHYDIVDSGASALPYHPLDLSGGTDHSHGLPIYYPSGEEYRQGCLLITGLEAPSSTPQMFTGLIPPATDDTYLLQCIVASGVAYIDWVADGYYL